MTFRIFYNSTTADASDSNNNYYHIGQGTISPMQGTSLANTTGTINLGSDAIRWNNAYINSVSTNTLSLTVFSAWEELYNSALDSDSASWQITLDPSDSDLMIFGMLETSTSTACDMELFINGATSASSNMQFFSANTTGTAGNTQTTYIYIFRNEGDTSTALKNFFVAKLNNYQSGFKKEISVHYASGLDGSRAGRTGFGSGLIGTTGTITSISFVPTAGQIKTGSLLTIMRMSEQ